MTLNKTDYLKQLDYMYQLYKHKDLLRNQIHPSSKTSDGSQNAFRSLKQKSTSYTFLLKQSLYCKINYI